MVGLKIVGVAVAHREKVTLESERLFKVVVVGLALLKTVTANLRPEDHPLGIPSFCLFTVLYDGWMYTYRTVGWGLTASYS